jgi:hypothetical protein
MLAALIHWCNLVSSTNVLMGYKEKRSVSVRLHLLSINCVLYVLRAGEQARKTGQVKLSIFI